MYISKEKIQEVEDSLVASGYTVELRVFEENKPSYFICTAERNGQLEKGCITVVLEDDREKLYCHRYLPNLIKEYGGCALAHSTIDMEITGVTLVYNKYCLNTNEVSIVPGELIPKIVEPLLRTLLLMHRTLKRCHGDFSSSNILFDPQADNAAIITDFEYSSDLRTLSKPCGALFEDVYDFLNAIVLIGQKMELDKLSTLEGSLIRAANLFICGERENRMLCGYQGVEVGGVSYEYSNMEYAKEYLKAMEILRSAIKNYKKVVAEDKTKLEYISAAGSVYKTRSFAAPAPAPAPAPASGEEESKQESMSSAGSEVVLMKHVIKGLRQSERKRVRYKL